jgi:hypothetical protein
MDTTTFAFAGEILEELCPGHADGDDTLLVLGKGLGLQQHILIPLFQACLNPETLVFLIHFEESDLRIFQSSCPNNNPKSNDDGNNNTGIDEEQQFRIRSAHFHRIASDATMNDRLAIYEKGGLIAVSSRMLMMDLLQDKIVPWFITGIIVLHAHTIHEFSNEAFIIYLFRQKCQNWLLESSSAINSNSSESCSPSGPRAIATGFIKAFTDEPEKFVQAVGSSDDMTTSVPLPPNSNYSFLEKRCKFLGVSRVILFPRYVYLPPTFLYIHISAHNDG